jgi:hypothetical protein
MAALSDDEHHGPVAAAEDSLKRVDVDVAGIGRIAGMGVNPDPPELVRPAAEGDLLLKEVGDRQIVKRDERFRTLLLNERDVLYR